MFVCKSVCVFCGWHLAKTVVIAQFSAGCKKYFFRAKSQKNTVNYLRKTSETTKSVQNGASLSTFKNEGSGWSGASFFWALLRQAPASPSQNAPKSEPPPPPILSPGLRLAFVIYSIIQHYTASNRKVSLWTPSWSKPRNRMDRTSRRHETTSTSRHDKSCHCSGNRLRILPWQSHQSPVQKWTLRTCVVYRILCLHRCACPMSNAS